MAVIVAQQRPITTQAARPRFRSDINGLRTWTVVAVILYHFSLPGLVGGFIGVDVFFVLSGFLMTGIVLRGLERGDFSRAAFYLARARRIVPGLASRYSIPCPICAAPAAVTAAGTASRCITTTIT